MLTRISFWIISITSELLKLTIYPFFAIFQKGKNSDLNCVVKGNSRTIVVQRGWFADTYFKTKFTKRLSSEGFDVYVTNFGYHFDDIDLNSKRLKKYITEKKLENVILLGTSLGGLISFNYLQNHGGWKKVDKLITISSPFKGTPIGYLVAFTKSGRQMIPGSKFIKNIVSTDPIKADKIYNIKGLWDEFVPTKSSYLPGANNITLDIFGHENVINSEKTLGKILEVAKR